MVNLDGAPRLAFAFILALILGLTAHQTRAQGGPPMITDDPGTPGSGRFEINLAVALEASA